MLITILNEMVANKEEIDECIDNTNRAVLEIGIQDQNDLNEDIKEASAENNAESHSSNTGGFLVSVMSKMTEIMDKK